MESADRGQSQLLSYGELYSLWERQQWAVQDIDFSQDRIDWHERIPAEERYQRMDGLSSFFIGEQRVAAELGPMMRAAPQEDMRIFLCTQIADEARHVAFFDRFYSEVGVLESDNLGGAAGGDQRARERELRAALRRDAQGPRRPPGGRARGPGDAGRGGHALPHGHRGDAGPDRPALHHRVQRAAGHAARLRRGLQQRGPRRAPPRGLRRRLPARHGRPRPQVRGRHPAHAGGVRPGRRRRADADVGRGAGRRRGHRDLRLLAGRHARVRDEGAGAAAEGHRARRRWPEAASRTSGRRAAPRTRGSAGSRGPPRPARPAPGPPTSPGRSGAAGS